MKKMFLNQIHMKVIIKEVVIKNMEYLKTESEYF